MKTEPKHLVFIDTEFTDFRDSQLISIGLVSETGAELYLEPTFPYNECSDFVKAVVLPLLWHTPDVTVTWNEITLRINAWLDSIRRGDEDIAICFDYITDWALFGAAMNYTVPSYIKPKVIGRNHFSKEVAVQYMVDNGLAEHHALYDARANKFAYEYEQQKRQELSRV